MSNSIAAPAKYERVYELSRSQLDETSKAVAFEVSSGVEALAERELGKKIRDIDEQAAASFASLETRFQEMLERAAVEVKKRQIKEIRVRNGRKVKKLNGATLPDEFGTICELAAIGQNTLLVGPSGSGKTFLAGKVAEALDRPFSANSCSAGMSESQLTGWLLPTEAGGAFNYVPSPFVNAYENGGIHLLDEIDAADENTIIFINGALAGNEFYLPQRYGNPRIKRHPEFVCIAAANTWGHGADEMYTGRNRMDAATMDRFRMGTVHVGYSDVVEDALVDGLTLDWGRSVRKAIAEHRLERIMSTRTLLDMTRQIQELNWPLDRCKRIYLSDWSKRDLQQLARSMGSDDAVIRESLR